MKKLIVVGIVAGLLALAGAGKVEAQCSGYSSSSPTKTVMTPDQVASQGGVAVTVNFSAVDGSGPSKKSSMGIGTNYNVNWYAANTTSVDFSFSWDGKTWYHLPNSYTSGNGNGLSFEQQVYPGWPVGGTYTLRLTGTGPNGTSQDRASIYIPASTAGIVSQDYIGTNFYAYMGSSFSGPSMLNACTLCQNQPYKCINKMHHPKQHWQVTNNSTGEYHDAGWTYGNAACENCAVNYGGSSPFISLNLGDSLSFNVENTVICDEFGVIYDNNGGDTFDWETEYAFTTDATIGSMCQLLDEGPQPDGTTHTGIECPISYFCKKGSAPPDFDPAYLASDRNCAVPNHCTESDIPVFPPYWLMGGFGVRIKLFGTWTTWQFPFYDAAGFVIGLRKKSDFINALFSIGNVALPSPFGANAISCTNSSLGTGPITWP